MRSSLMMLFMIMLAVLCRVRSKSKPPPPPPTDGGPPAPPPDIKDYCESDIKVFCPKHRNSWLILCLYENKSQLSKKCQSYLGTTTIGGCNNEATNLCPDQTNVDDIYNCLDQHRDKLGQACVLNLANRNETSTAMNSAQEEYKRITFTVTAISAVYLSIPLCLCLLAAMYMSSLLHEQDTVLAEGVDTWIAATSLSSSPASPMSTQKATNLPNEGVSSDHSIFSSHTTPHNATESQLSTEIDSAAVNTIKPPSSSPRAWTIGFHQLSYWTPEKTDWMGNKLPKQQILKEISGEFRSSAVSAIMGPSGSGKTTLLQLVGGQMASGEFSGTRVINRTRPSAKVYDKVLRGQGYVSQQDTLLQSLTVWQSLVYCALLKLPIHMARKDKLYQAARIMYETGLVPIARNVIGSASGGSEGGGVVQKGISGGQRRRLSIALELIGGPAVLLLDEPTSGLDSSSSLRVVTLLQRMSRKLHTTIALTIHQPRAEVFGLFDSLLLLGTGGHLIYSGPSVSAAAFLSSCSAVRLPLNSYDNPGDFIIDILGLETSAGEEEERVLLSSDSQHGLLDAAGGGQRSHCNSSNTNDSGDIEQLHVSTSPSQTRNNQEDDCRALTAQLSRHFLQSEQFTALQQHFRAENITELVADSSDDRSTAWRTVQHFSLSGGDDGAHNRNFISNRTTYNPLSSSSAHGTESADDEEGVEMTSATSSSAAATGTAAGDSQLIVKKPSEDSLVTDDHSPLLDRQSRKPTNEAPCASGTLSEKEWLTSYDHRVALPIWMQVPVLFSRRVQTIAPTRYQFSMLALQILCVAAVVTRTFSYRTSTEFERPYQVVMLLSILCLYAMILQYLLLIPEYMAERGVIVREYSCGCVSYHAYILSVLLTEVPRALVQCVVLVAVLYAMHPLNDDRVNVLFCVVCLVVGVTAWQALICLCSVMTDAISVAYTAVFLILGSGTLFGGLLVRLQKIPVYFRFLYYVSVAAVTQRALVTNDMQCCYLTATCNGIAKDFQTSSALSNPITVGSFDNSSVTMTTFCPPGLQFTGDGSDVGNLGKVYLVMLGLDVLFLSFCCSWRPYSTA